MNLVRVQIRKMFRRTDVITSYLLFFLAPMILALMIKMESNIITIGESVFSGISYVSVIVGLLKGLFVFYILIILFSTSLIAGEIDNMTDAVYYCKVERRIDIILSKIITLVIMIFLLILDICLSASVGWAMFLRNSRFGYTQYWAASNTENSFMIMMVLFSFAEIVVIMMISANLSLFFSQGKALIGSFFTVIIFKLIENLEEIQMYVPTFIGNLSNALELNGENFWHEIMKSGFIFLIYAIILATILVVKYNRMDYVR